MKTIRSRIFKYIRLIGRKIYKRRVWLISDRSVWAGDNGEAFFKYLKSQNVDCVFAIKKKSRDFERISQIGETVEYESLKYRFLLCVCECHCSSQPIHMENHTEAPQIFLQHGVAETDISNIINPNTHENFYVITSAQREKESFLGPSYNISERHVWLTGLPRFDYLENKPKKMLAIMFTWREKLLSLSKSNIYKSKYFCTLMRLLEDKELNEFLVKEGYEICIMLHPEMRFLRNFVAEPLRSKIFEKSYNEILSKASIVVTDYSSSIYDFIYMGKPMIYYQFDNGDYYDNSYTSKGYFDYSRDGFGPVTKEYVEFVETLKNMIQNGCVMEELYKNRVDSFLAYRDKHNCERVYTRILEILNKC